jgi:hypothetical protein
MDYRRYQYHIANFRWSIAEYDFSQIFVRKIHAGDKADAREQQ